MGCQSVKQKNTVQQHPQQQKIIPQIENYKKIDQKFPPRGSMPEETFEKEKHHHNKKVQSNVRSSRNNAQRVSQSALRSDLRIPTKGKVETKKHPASKQVYGVDSMKGIDLNQIQTFEPVKKFNIYDTGYLNRQEDYQVEDTTANISKLKSNKQILSYDLDTQDGVSKTPLVNTFQYDTFLNHNIQVGNNVVVSNLRASKKQI